MSRAKFARRPCLGKLAKILARPAVRIPREAEEELRRQLVALEVADVHDPNPIGAVALGERHLVPDLRQRARIEPLIAPGPAVIVEVVIDARAAASLTLFRGRKPADVAPVVLGPE